MMGSTSDILRNFGNRKIKIGSMWVEISLWDFHIMEGYSNSEVWN